MQTTQSVSTRGLSGAEPHAGVALQLRTLAAAGLKWLCDEVALSRRARRDRQELLTLDNRMLADVGLTRHHLRQYPELD